MRSCVLRGRDGEDRERQEGLDGHAGVSGCEILRRGLRVPLEGSGFDPKNPKASNNSLKTYATNPLWQVVDGPWHLSSFSPSGYVAMKPNPHYSGPVKPRLDRFVELPFTSSTAEFNALVGGKVSVGYLPTEDITSPAKSLLVPGENNARLSKFVLDPWYSWGISYFPYNFNSTGDGGQAGKTPSQLYFRQAFQMLVDQPLYDEKIYKNYVRADLRAGPCLPEELLRDQLRGPEPVSRTTRARRSRSSRPTAGRSSRRA